jgi:arylformamidase
MRRIGGTWMFTKVYDISMTIRPNIQVWENKDSKRPEFKNMSNFETGEVYETRLSLDLHTGTHVDAPLHMIDGGAAIEATPLEGLVGPARVLDLTHVEDGIGRGDLEGLGITRGERLLFKTRSSFSDSDDFDFGFVYLKEDGALYLAEIGIAGVGTDALGIERSQAEFPTHRSLLSRGIWIAEGLRLRDVPAGSYYLVLAPLKLEGVEAAPARAFLLG